VQKLKLEFKEAWVKALRSGEWLPAKNLLGIANTNQRCCLGVALEVMGIVPSIVDEGILCYNGEIYTPSREMWQEVIADGSILDTTVDPFSVLISQNFPRVQELRVLLGYLDVSQFFVSLPSLNDKGIGFDMIADIVECYG